MAQQEHHKWVGATRNQNRHCGDPGAQEGDETIIKIAVPSEAASEPCRKLVQWAQRDANEIIKPKTAIGLHVVTSPGLLATAAASLVLIVMPRADLVDKHPRAYALNASAKLVETWKAIAANVVENVETASIEFSSINNVSHRLQIGSLPPVLLMSPASG